MEPAAAHLVHMPAHIYLRVGDWRSAAEANEHAVHHALDYRLSTKPTEQRACGHCADFLTYAYMMEGKEGRARGSANDYQQLSGDPSDSIAVLLRFHEWEDMLTFPEPAADLKVSYRNVHAIRGFWHFGRGLAFVATSRVERAGAELDALLNETALAPHESAFGSSLELEQALNKISQNTDAAILKISAALLRARMAEARGELPESVRLLREAVNLQDNMPYGEPPSWFYPIRESLGAILLKSGSAAEAESVFREGLSHSPHNGRLLLGLSEAVGAQGRAAEAAKVRSEFDAAWHESDAKVAVATL
jgi:tetratricopeptide (TPR) repeat protein